MGIMGLQWNDSGRKNGDGINHAVNGGPMGMYNLHFIYGIWNTRYITINIKLT